MPHARSLADLSQQIHRFLSDIDLAKLVERRRVREVARRQDGARVEVTVSV